MQIDCCQFWLKQLKIRMVQNSVKKKFLQSVNKLKKHKEQLHKTNEYIHVMNRHKQTHKQRNDKIKWLRIRRS